VNVLLMEGTTIARTETESGFPTETDIENELVDIFRNTNGMPLVWCSGQNIDRIVTVFRACKRSDRQFIVDMYAAEILKATDNPQIPQAHWKEISVYLPRSQKARIICQKDFDVAKYYRPFRIFEESLAEVARQSVMLFRPNMRWELEETGCLAGACLVYSMWDGYLEKEETKPFLAWLEQKGISMHKCHTSGHASVSDLRRLRKAFASAVVVPIHTEQPALFKGLFDNVEIHGDNECWEA
jgi:ribonuclease J